MSDMRKYTDYNRRLLNSRKFQFAQKQKIMQDQLAAVQKANNEYSTIAQKYKAKIDTLEAQLDPATAMKTCQDTILTENTKAIVTANELMDCPNDMCDKFTAEFTTFLDKLDTAYAMVGAPVPK